MLETLFRRREGAQYVFLDAGGARAVQCVGLATRRPERFVTAETTFHNFSTTKVVTALAVLQLVDEGLLSLDTPLAEVLPEIPYRNGATVRHALSHQAGLPNPLPLSWVHADKDHGQFSASAFYERVLREHPRASAPGRKSRYSNIGFLLLGRLVEVLRGLPYEEVVRQRVLAPVAETPPDPATYLDFAIPGERHATGYTRRWSGLGLFVSLLGDPARLRVREGDQLRYRPFHLDGAAYGGLKGNALGWAPLLMAMARRDPRLLSPRGFETFFAPQPLQSGAPSGHALAWFTGRLGDHDYLCHAGGGPGYYAEVRVYPGLSAASAVFANITAVSDLRLLDRLDRSALP